MARISTSHERQHLYQCANFETFCERHGVPTGQTIPDAAIKLAQDAWFVHTQTWAPPRIASLADLREYQRSLDIERDALLGQARAALAQQVAAA